MRFKDMGPAERALVEAKIEMKRLKKEKRTKESNKRIKQLEGIFALLNRNAYLEKKKRQKARNTISIGDIEKQEEELLQQKIREDLERRKNGPKPTHLEVTKDTLSEAPNCDSCGAPLLDIYGVIRCKCN